MRVPKIKISFTEYSDSNLLTKTTHIVSSMSQPVFVDPVPTLAEVMEALGIYSNALTAAEGLGKNNVVAKNEARAVLEQLLSQLGRWVMFQANGSLAILTASGFTLTKDPQPRRLENPGNVTLGNGNTSGTMVSSVPKGNATSYLHEISDTLSTENMVWTKYPSNNCQFTFSGLTPGKQYWVKVAAIGYRNQVSYSTVATQFAQ